MSIHIGKIIKQKVEESGINKSEFSRRINTTPQNVYGIFKRKSIDTDLLDKISHVLDIDFFAYYNHPLNVVKEGKPGYSRGESGRINELLHELEKYKSELAQARKEITYLKKINELLEKQLEEKK
jgi:transcriptional regulator with XRE-family HTH domain